MAAAAQLLNEKGDWGLSIDDEVCGLVPGLEVVDGVTEGVFGLSLCILHGFFGFRFPTPGPFFGVTGVVSPALLRSHGVVGVLAEGEGCDWATWDGGVPASGPEAVDLVHPIAFSRGGGIAERIDLIAAAEASADEILGGDPFEGQGDVVEWGVIEAYSLMESITDAEAGPPVSLGSIEDCGDRLPHIPSPRGEMVDAINGPLVVKEAGAMGPVNASIR